MKIPVLSNMFNRQQQPEPIKNAMIISGLQEATKPGDFETAWKEQQGTNYELLHDDPIEAVLNEMMYERAVVYNDDTQKWEVIKRAGIDLNMVGLRLTASHVNRASFNDKRDVEILKTKLRGMTKLVKMQMRPDTFTLGMSTFLSGLEYYNEIALNDSVDGKKAKLTKTIPKVTSVEVSTGELPQPKRGS